MMIRFIGDIHGDSATYLKLIRDAEDRGIEKTIQVGDLGFNYSFLKDVDGSKHKVLAGNHDNYAKWGTSNFIHMQTPHWLGDYGITENGVFYVRGGYSIDWRYRVEGRDLSQDEQLSVCELGNAIGSYKSLTPKIMVSHEAPSAIVQAMFQPKVWDGELLTPSRTSLALQTMYDLHRPKLWVFGHFHETRYISVGSTDQNKPHNTAYCVGAGDYVDVNMDNLAIEWRKSTDSHLTIHS